MPLPKPARTGTALILCIIAALSTAQTAGIMPGFVSADNTLTIQLLRAPTSTDSLLASGNVLVNLDNGQVRFEMHQAAQNSVYAALFISTSSSARLGVGALVTGSGGDGDFEGSMSAGTYVGIFELTKLGVVQFISATTSFTIGGSASASASATVSTTQTSSQTTSAKTEKTISVSNTAQFLFQVDPPSRSISAGAFAKFDIRIAHSANANVFLTARGVPPSSGLTAIFTPNLGVADPEFHSTLTVVTSAETPPGIYTVTVVALVNGQEFTTQLALQVATSSTITTSVSGTMTVTAGTSLSISVSTDQSLYQPNATVNIQGHVTDSTGSAAAGAAISVQVDAPTGTEVFFTSNAQTDAAGVFNIRVELSADAVLGAYAVFASASKAGYSSATTRTTFVVGTSTTPSVIIKAVYAGDSSGNPTSIFSVGQTVWVWVVIENIGATFQGVVWIQVRDPNGVPVQIQIHIANLHTGETVKDGLGFTLTGKPVLGVYTINALVSDKLISQGGTFLANADTQFALTG